MDFTNFLIKTDRDPDNLANDIIVFKSKKFIEYNIIQEIMASVRQYSYEFELDTIIAIFTNALPNPENVVHVSQEEARKLGKTDCACCNDVITVDPDNLEYWADWRERVYERANANPNRTAKPLDRIIASIGYKC